MIVQAIANESETSGTTSAPLRDALPSKIMGNDEGGKTTAGGFISPFPIPHPIVFALRSTGAWKASIRLLGSLLRPMYCAPPVRWNAPVAACILGGTARVTH